MDPLVAVQPVPLPGSALVFADVRVLPPRGLNTSGYLDLNHFSQQTAWAHSFMHAYALWLGPVLLAAVFVATYALAWWWRAPRAAALLILGGAGTLVALALNQLVGHAAKELRPYATQHHALVLVARANDYSFPSDHAVVAGGLTVSLLLVVSAKVWQTRPGVPSGSTGQRPTEPSVELGVVRGLAAVNVVLGLFLCFARVYVGAHYPGDVVAGYLLASVVVLLFSLLRPLAFRVVDLLEPTVLGASLRRPGPVLGGEGVVVEPQPEPAAARRQRVS